MTRTGRIDVSIGGEELTRGTARLGTLTATASGTLQDHRLDLDLSGGEMGFTLHSDGGWNGNTLTHRINAFDLDTGVAGKWQIRQAFDVQVGASSFRFGAHCWEQAITMLCMQNGLLSETRLSLAGNLDALELSAFQTWIGEDFTLSGTASAEFDLQREVDSLAGRFVWNQDATRISFRDSESTTIESHLNKVRLEIETDETVSHVTGSILSDFGVAVNLNADILNPLVNDPGIAGRLRIDAPDIAEAMPLLNRFFAVSKLQGRLDADLRITGTLFAPRIDGVGRLADGSAYLPQTGIDIEAIELTLQGQNELPLKITGSAESGGGRLSINGTLNYSTEAGPSAELSLTGENFQIIRSPSQTVYVSPDLQSRIDPDRVAVSGVIRIPKAEIMIETLPESATAPSPDVVVETTTAETTVRRSPMVLTGDLDLVLGDEVHFAGFGIDTRLAGRLSLSRAPANATSLAEGNLRTVDGRFEAYRKKLTIERGGLIFSGPLDDPNLDVRASRQLEYQGQLITVGVLLTGPLSNIRTTVFSDPTMSEGDALSYLVLDRPLSRTEGADSADLSSAAVALGLSQALPVTEQLEDSLGLDEVTFEGTNNDTTSIVAGKRLAEKLYVRYSYGLFNRIGAFIVRYDLKRGFSIEAGSGEEQTLDLIFSIQR